MQNEEHLKSSQKEREKYTRGVWTRTINALVESRAVLEDYFTEYGTPPNGPDGVDTRALVFHAPLQESSSPEMGTVLVALTVDGPFTLYYRGPWAPRELVSHLQYTAEAAVTESTSADGYFVTGDKDNPKREISLGKKVGPFVWSRHIDHPPRNNPLGLPQATLRRANGLRLQTALNLSLGEQVGKEEAKKVRREVDQAIQATGLERTRYIESY